MTFTDFFKQIGLGVEYEQFAWILDSPEQTFNAVKDDLLNSLAADFSGNALINEVTKNDNISIAELKFEIEDTYQAFIEVLEDESVDLPKDRVEFFLQYLTLLKDAINNLPDRKMVQVVIEKTNENAIIPTYAHNSDAGADVYAIEDIEIPPYTTVVVDTGLKVSIPLGWEIQVRPRSGMSLKTPIRIANAPGTIDSGYRDSIGIICHNVSQYPYTIHKGDRIAQFLIASTPMILFVEGKVTNEGDRGGGFGSSGQ